MSDADRYLQAAIEEARQGLSEGGIPIGDTWVHPTDLVAIGLQAADEADVAAAR